MLSEDPVNQYLASAIARPPCDLTTMCALLAALPCARAQPSEQTVFKAVLVTGASSGIGRKITERLAADGYFVYATARKDADLKMLAAIKNVQPVRLDVTQPADIAAAVDLVNKAGRGLYALVNNAGVGTYGTIADMSPEEFDLCMKVNVYGPVMMIEALEPMIIAQQGRIINIGSLSGILASPNLPAYVMSKHAIEGLTDSLAVQLAPAGFKSASSNPVTTTATSSKACSRDSRRMRRPKSRRWDRSRNIRSLTWSPWRLNKRWLNPARSAATWSRRIRAAQRGPFASRSSS